MEVATLALTRRPIASAPRERRRRFGNANDARGGRGAKAAAAVAPLGTRRSRPPWQPPRSPSLAASAGGQDGATEDAEEQRGTRCGPAVQAQPSAVGLPRRVGQRGDVASLPRP